MTDRAAEALAGALAAMSPWEALAVALAIAYLLLAIRQNVLCWVAAIASAGIYVVLMLRAGLYMQSLLQLFYIGMAAYGWWHWRHGGGGDPPGAGAGRNDDNAGGNLPVTSWPLRRHAAPLALVAVLGGLTGWLLDSYTAAALPWVDAWVTWGAIVTTWMVARKVLQNWHWWFVIDSVSIWLYAHQGLWLTAALFAVYLVLIVFGYRSWRASMLETRVGLANAGA